MKITAETLYTEIKPFEKYMSKQTVENLKRKAETKYGEMYDLEFGTFYACANGDFSHLGDVENPTALQYYWCLRFRDFMDEFANALLKLQPKQTQEEKEASSVLLKTDWGENILVFLQQWFGLKSYKEAERITIGEILIAKRAAYNLAVYQRKLAAIQRQKYDKKK